MPSPPLPMGAESGGDITLVSALRVARLKMVGSCRNEDDSARLQALKQYSEVGAQGSVCT